MGHNGSIKAHQSLIAAKKRPFARIRLATRRCFVLGSPILVRQILARAYPKLRHFRSWHYHSVRRALRSEGAVQIARCRYGRGRPALWAKR